VTQHHLPSSRPFDLVILDLDGTLLDLYRPAPITPAVHDAIAAVQAAGVMVTIATGRTLDYVRKHVAQLGLTHPVVTTQGAVIGDPVSGHILEAADIPLPLARDVAAWLDRQPNVIALYFHDDDDRTVIYQNRTGPDTDFYDHVFGNPRTLQPRFAELLVNGDAAPPLKFIMVEETGASGGEELINTLRAQFTPGLTITRTHPRLVEGTRHGVDKGEGLRQLCRRLGVEPERVLAIGDSDNDIPMLQAAGLGIAMGNSTPGLLAVADWVAPPIDQDGVATALEQWVLAHK
jgi:Cof subfamily protein (haloacid dehalogenase superfamily)